MHSILVFTRVTLRDGSVAVQSIGMSTNGEKAGN